jgi:hypothetical protein
MKLSLPSIIFGSIMMTATTIIATGETDDTVSSKEMRNRLCIVCVRQYYLAAHISSLIF